MWYNRGCRQVIRSTGTEVPAVPCLRPLEWVRGERVIAMYDDDYSPSVIRFKECAAQNQCIHPDGPWLLATPDNFLTRGGEYYSLCVRCLSKQQRKRMSQYYASKRPIPCGYVYFIQSIHGGPIKIGFTKGAIEKRVSGLKSQSPVDLILLGYLEGTTQTEKELHAQFNRLHYKGEWFKPGKSLIDYIEKGGDVFLFEKPRQNFYFSTRTPRNRSKGRDAKNKTQRHLPLIWRDSDTVLDESDE